jgi:HAD superfamily phosphoserine phosphatase-like hydrolase
LADHPKIAVYDLDRTITMRGTYTPFLLHCVVTRAPWRLVFVPAVVGAMLLHVLKTIDRRTLKSWMLALLLGRCQRTHVSKLAHSFHDLLLRTGGIRPGALAQIARDRADGRLLVMATASFDFYASVIGARLGFDVIVATRSVWAADDQLVAGVAGDNCYGAAKLAMLTATLGDTGPDRVFYSDHHSDVPCFVWAGKGFAVNPTRKLSAMATQLGARVVDWGEVATV